ncbi:Hypothetical protein DEACI_2632 [Acididesulfobacillus acetoxydans]|uniref:FeoB-associated Cys-rich membrane protein n=1 Tax=Acididesulfobacillus acetoxydans TaxID=1561005 RepID=A0A8S0WZH8_9FIRM|nr:hypothetical protein [Acididesulfobacillus acetoxydans]CAA7601961.1 Hypothetical protein DEACI_2632 [Acididesulfobacillus acetoxydans]CEJ08195.1 Hypothetical protein DEACI_2670 [Acididesulfobacillus acetoxydans]
MNLPTLFIGFAVVALLVLAIRYIINKGACAACEAKGAYQSARAGSNIPLGCGGCRGCHHCSGEDRPFKSTADHSGE